MEEWDKDDRFNYTRPGEFQVIEMQCEKCKHKGPNPMVCEKFVKRKPPFVLRVEAECPKFELAE